MEYAANFPYSDSDGCAPGDFVNVWRKFFIEIQLTKGQTRQGAALSHYTDSAGVKTMGTGLCNETVYLWMLHKRANIKVRLSEDEIFDPEKGLIHSWRIPPLARPFIYYFYSIIYRVKIEEAADTNLSSYPNLGAFFRRPIDPKCRPLARTNLGWKRLKRLKMNF